MTPWVVAAVVAPVEVAAEAEAPREAAVTEVVVEVVVAVVAVAAVALVAVVVVVVVAVAVPLNPCVTVWVPNSAASSTTSCQLSLGVPPCLPLLAKKQMRLVDFQTHW